MGNLKRKFTPESLLKRLQSRLKNVENGDKKAVELFKKITNNKFKIEENDRFTKESF